MPYVFMELDFINFNYQETIVLFKTQSNSENTQLIIPLVNIPKPVLPITCATLGI